MSDHFALLIDGKLLWKQDLHPVLYGSVNNPYMGDLAGNQYHLAKTIMYSWGMKLPPFLRGLPHKARDRLFFLQNYNGKENMLNFIDLKLGIDRMVQI